MATRNEAAEITARQVPNHAGDTSRTATLNACRRAQAMSRKAGTATQGSSGRLSMFGE